MQSYDPLLGVSFNAYNVYLQRIEGIRRKDARAMACEGMALAVVRDDQPILCEGFGFRNISQDYDIFEVFFETADQHQKIAFTTDLHGKVARIAAQLEPKVSEISFNRLPD